MTTVTRTELFDINALQNLMRCDAVADSDKKNLTKYRRRARLSGNNKNLVQYQFSKNWADLKLGRLVAEPYLLSQQGMSSQLVAALAQKYYWDVDIVNCQPQLLLQFAKKEGLPYKTLETFCSQRDEILQEIQDTLHWTRDEAKTSIITTIFGGYSLAHPLLPALRKELHQIACLIIKQHPEIYERVQQLKEVDHQKKLKDPLASSLAIFVQNEERLCFEAMDTYIQTLNRVFDVYKYDGGHLRKLEDESSCPETLLRGAEQAIYTATGYTVSLSVKPFVHSFEFDRNGLIYPLDAVIDDLFACQMLVKKNPDKFLKDGQDVFMKNPETGLWQPYNLEDTKAIVFDNKEALIFKQHTATGIATRNYGGDIKKISTMLSCLSQCVPTGQVPIEFLGSLGEQGGDPEISERVVDLYGQLLSVMSNNNQEKKDYLVKYLAHALQKPRDLPGVCLVVTGGQGCGKDTTFNIFMDYVIGSTYAKSFDKNEHFFNPYDSSKSRKVMVKLEEAAESFCRDNKSSLKSLITASKITINPKLKKEYQTDNFARYVFTTNEGNPIALEGSDRRYVLYDCSLEKTTDRDFWIEVNTLLRTEQAGRILYRHFMGIDLSGFDVMKFPISEYQQGIQADWKTIEEMFLDDWDGEEASGETIYPKYRNFCLRLKIKEDTICSKNVFCKRLSAFCRDGKVIRRLLHGIALYSKADADPQIE